MASFNFEILQGSPNSRVVLHVPHAARVIPSAVRTEILLNDEELAIELEEMTDADTDLLALHASAQAQVQPWIFKNNLSRLVIDPERFPDDREIMNSIGMGAVYLRTSTGTALREANDARDQKLLQDYFHPYALAFEELIRDRLNEVGAVTIVDVHSYRVNEHANGVNKGERRPPVCLGTDSFHTPGWLISLATNAFSFAGDVFANEPYAGTYVPMAFYEKEANVTSVMMENREDNLAGAGMERSSEALARLIMGIGKKD